MVSLEKKPTCAGSFAFTSPYGGFWTEHFYGLIAHNLYEKKVVRESDFRERLAEFPQLPEIMLMGNFIADRAGIVSICRQLGINTVHGEDGFFPHYSTCHADPLGFCWESSLTHMVFHKCTDTQLKQARSLRQDWLNFSPQELPAGLKAPFVLWPLQLIGDKVNQWDLNVKDWTGVLKHFRQSLPPEIQLVLKRHPRSKDADLKNVKQWIRDAPNTIMLPEGVPLKDLLWACNAVAGANSSVLYEARLMFHKPVYAYARGWFSNHTELFTPMFLNQRPRELARLDFLVDNAAIRTERLDDYTDWFLAQLLARQMSHEAARKEPVRFKQWVHRLSYQSFCNYGQEIFG